MSLEVSLFALEILQSAYASVQDGGRLGAEHWGVARSGFADARHGQLANALCGNELKAAVLEIFVGRFIARFLTNTCFATAGAQVKLFLDGTEVPVGAKILAREGSILSLGPARRGRILYLALPGGIDVQAVLGSCATDLGAGFGGLDGRLLHAGDHLRWRAVDAVPPRSHAYLAPLAETEALRFVPAEWLHLEVIERFIGTLWRVHPQSQRSGVRLLGPNLPPLAHDGVSRAVVPGAIQLPPEGLPIVLGVDAQTIGGYPLLGTLIAADLWRLAQLGASQPLRFQPCDLTCAYQLAGLERSDFQRALIGIEHHFGTAHCG